MVGVVLLEASQILTISIHRLTIPNDRSASNAGAGMADDAANVAEFTEVYQIESDFEAKVRSGFAKMLEHVVTGTEV